MTANRLWSRSLRLPPVASRLALAGTVAAALAGGPAVAHPGSGIGVDRQGRVFFVDTGHGVWVLDAAGKLEQHEGPAFHWMALDPASRFGATPFRRLPTTDMRAVGRDPMVILSSDYPVAVGTDGALYFPELGPDERLRVIRMTASGERAEYALLPPGSDGAPLRWLNGVAASGDGSLYYAENAAVRRIRPDRAIEVVASSVVVPDCQRVEGWEPHLGPYLRGLAVAPDGVVYAAATGCGAVLRLGADGSVTVALRATAPWSPTAVAVDGSDVYVLEYLHPPGVVDRVEWIPRVRKLAADGSIVTLVEIARERPSPR